MKQIYLVLLVTFMMLWGCSKNNDFTRYQAAVLIANHLEITDYDRQVSDVNLESKDANKVLAVLSRNIFGKIGSRYQFNGSLAFNRYDLAKVAINTYSYLLGIEDENLAPGRKCTISDITDLTPMQKWYVYAAVDYGFIELKDVKFEPTNNVSEAELTKTLEKVLLKASKTPLDLDRYQALKLENFSTAPKPTATFSSFIDVYYPNNNRGERLLATSLQGLVNREKVSIYLDMLNETWITDYAIAKGYFSGINEKFTDVFALLEKYCHLYDLNKFVVYDANNPFTINTATDIASVEGRLIISEEMVAKIKTIVANPDILFLDELNLKSQYDAQKYVYENYYPFLRRDILGWSYYGAQQDFVRDYAIQMQYPILWIPGSSSNDYDSRTQVLVSDILQNYPANIPVIGFQYAAEVVNGIVFDMGIGEFTGVNLCGEYGKYTAVFDSVGNLSFHTAFKIEDEKLQYQLSDKTYQVYDPNKKYVAITMTESGDAPAYIQYGLNQRQWSEEERLNTPYNYSYGLNNYDLLPLYTQYFFETANEKSYFFGAISGLGYSYPLASFGSKGVKNEDGIYMLRPEIMKDHYQKVNVMMKRLGFTSLGVYGYPDSIWGKYDYLDFDEYALKYLTNVETIMADMHRPARYVDTPLVKEGLYGHRIYHCSTFWSLADLGSSADRSKDDIAVDYLYNEILKNTKNGSFFQCMAYSWHYGPRRVKLVIDKIEQNFPGMYEFVTIDELDNYYLQSKQIGE